MAGLFFRAFRSRSGRTARLAAAPDTVTAPAAPSKRRKQHAGSQGHPDHRRGRGARGDPGRRRLRRSSSSSAASSSRRRRQLAGGRERSVAVAAGDRAGDGRAHRRGRLGVGRRYPGQPGLPHPARQGSRLLDEVPGGLGAEGHGQRPDDPGQEQYRARRDAEAPRRRLPGLVRRSCRHSSGRTPSLKAGAPTGQ